MNTNAAHGGDRDGFISLADLMAIQARAQAMLRQQAIAQDASMQRCLNALEKMNSI